jgi:NAD(P)-dependent dehydrogenase (short-subunit alcohol dehydrogenase family)
VPERTPPPCLDLSPRSPPLTDLIVLPFLPPPLSFSHSGIGLESALVFASEGAIVVVADINEEAAKKAVELIKSEVPGANAAMAIKCDVSKEKDIEELVAKTVEKFGRLDVMLCVLFSLACPFFRPFFPLVLLILHLRSNNAGIMHPADDNALNTEERIWDLTMNSSFSFFFSLFCTLADLALFPQCTHFLLSSF